MALYTVIGDVGVIKINNPPVNALSIKTSKELLLCIDKAQSDRTRAIVLCGTGRQFSAGADITEFDLTNENKLQALIDVTNALENSRKPVVAAIHGYAFGGGFELAISCHYRLAQKDAKFGLPEVKLGILPAAGGTQRLPRLIGLDQSMEWISKGRSYTAVAARTAGIIDMIVSDQDIIKAAIEFAKDVAEKPMNDRITSLLPVSDSQDVEEIYRKHSAACYRRARGQFSPLACLQAVKFSSNSTFKKGLKKEAELFKTLVTSGQSRGMIHSFFGERQVQKWSIPSRGITWNTAKPLVVRKGAVIGLGTMGRGIAINFLKAGVPVMVSERDEASLKVGVKNIIDIIESMVQHDVISPEQGTKMKGAVTYTMDYSDFKDVDLIIEAVFEEIEIKREVFKKLDKVCKPSAILASNTSALDIDEIARCTNRPHKVMGMHFFSPADRMTLLENVYGAKTSPETIATCMDMGRRMGKVTVLVGNCYGFVANRMYIRYMDEADYLLEEGAYPQDVDKALTDYGFAMGRFRVADLAGNDVNYRVRRAAGLTAEHQLAGTPVRERKGIRYCPLADYLCQKGRYGLKSNKGWFDYGNGNGSPIPSPEVMEMIVDYRLQNGISPRRIDHIEILERTLYPLINEGFKALDEGYASTPVDIDMIWIHGYAWPKHTGGPMFYAQTIGLPKLLAVITHYYNHFNRKVPHWEPSRMLVSLVEKHGNPPMNKWMECASHKSDIRSKL